MEEEQEAAPLPEPAPAHIAETVSGAGFVHLHNHSDFSLLDGAAKISSYVEKAKSYGMTISEASPSRAARSKWLSKTARGWANGWTCFVSAGVFWKRLCWWNNIIICTRRYISSVADASPPSLRHILGRKRRKDLRSMGRYSRSIRYGEALRNGSSGGTCTAGSQLRSHHHSFQRRLRLFGCQSPQFDQQRQDDRPTVAGSGSRHHLRRRTRLWNLCRR